MARDRRLDVEDILQSCEVVQHFAADRTRSAIQEDAHVVDVLMHNIEIIGETAMRLGNKFHSDIRDEDWDAILGIPDVMAEGHAEESDQVWRVIEEVIPSVHSKVRFYLV